MRFSIIEFASSLRFYLYNINKFHKRFPHQGPQLKQHQCSNVGMHWLHSMWSLSTHNLHFMGKFFECWLTACAIAGGRAGTLRYVQWENIKIIEKKWEKNKRKWYNAMYDILESRTFSSFSMKKNNKECNFYIASHFKHKFNLSKLSSYRKPDSMHRRTQKKKYSNFSAQNILKLKNYAKNVVLFAHNRALCLIENAVSMTLGTMWGYIIRYNIWPVSC